MKNFILGALVISIISVASFRLVLAQQDPDHPQEDSTYSYQLKTDVDPCILVTMGEQGFKAIRAGVTISGSESGKNIYCETASVRKLNWVLFEKEM